MADGETQGFVRTPGLDNTLSYMGSLISFLVGKDETGKTLSAIIAYGERGAEPPPHIHFHENETYFVLEGGVDIYIEGRPDVLHAEVGDVAFLPVGKAHGLKITSKRLKAFVTLTAAPGQEVSTEDFFKMTAIGPAENMSIPDNGDHYKDVALSELQAIAAMLEEYGARFLTPDEIRTKLPLFQTGL